MTLKKLANAYTILYKLYTIEDFNVRKKWFLDILESLEDTKTGYEYALIRREIKKTRSKIKLNKSIETAETDVLEDLRDAFVLEMKDLIKNLKKDEEKTIKLRKAEVEKIPINKAKEILNEYTEAVSGMAEEINDKLGLAIEKNDFGLNVNDYLIKLLKASRKVSRHLGFEIKCIGVFRKMLKTYKIKGPTLFVIVVDFLRRMQFSVSLQLENYIEERTKRLKENWEMPEFA